VPGTLSGTLSGQPEDDTRMNACVEIIDKEFFKDILNERES